MGMALGEAVVFFNQELAEDFAHRFKQAGQLASKMRYLTAPWVAMLAAAPRPPRQRSTKREWSAAARA